MDHIFLTRNQYNWLVTNCYSWMNLRWNEYVRRWDLAGVLIKAEPWKIENIRCQIPEDVV